jgi:hypothetical protein
VKTGTECSFWKEEADKHWFTLCTSFQFHKLPMSEESGQMDKWKKWRPLSSWLLVKPSTHFELTKNLECISRTEELFSSLLATCCAFQAIEQVTCWTRGNEPALVFCVFWVPGNSGSCPQLDEEKSKHTAFWLSKMVLAQHFFTGCWGW